MATKTQPAKRIIPDEPSVQPPFFFLQFHEATRDGDVKSAAEAQMKLREAGYSVKVLRNRGDA